MRVLVCGTRTYSDVARLRDTLNLLHSEQPFSVLIEGEARGADTLARQWAEDRGIPVERYPADWQKHHRAAGPIRNARMLSEGRPDLVVAFLDRSFEESLGTRNMVTLSRQASIRTMVIVSIPNHLRSSAAPSGPVMTVGDLQTDTHFYGDGCGCDHGQITPDNLAHALGGPDTAEDIAADPDLYYADAVDLPAGRDLSPEAWRDICGGAA